MHEVFIGIGHHLNNATAALETIYGQLLAIEQQTRRRSPGGFARYLLAMFIGVAALLAWQSYSEAAKQIIATNAPELGWSPGARQMIAGWVQQLRWSRHPPLPKHCSAVCAGYAATGKRCADCARERNVETRRPLHRPGAGASNSVGCSRTASNHRADCRRSRPNGARGR